MKRKSSLWFLILVLVSGSFTALGSGRETARAAPANLALGKTVTMSKPAAWGQVAAHMTDGDDNTLSQAESNDPWSFTIDLGALYVVDRVVLKPHPSAYPTVFTVQTSADEAVWHTAAQESAGAETGGTYDFAPVKARYVYIEVSAISNPNQAMKEVEVYAMTEDTFAPEEVTQTSVVAGSGTLTLQWMDPPDADFQEVRIYDENDTQLTTVSKGTRSASLTGLTNGTEYVLTLKTADQLGNLSTGVIVRGTPETPALDLQAIRVDGTDLQGFDAGTLAYEVELPDAAPAIPRLQATAVSANDRVTVVQAESVPGTGRITVTGAGSETKTYEVRFRFAPNTPAAGTRLSGITIDGSPLAEFDPDQTRYLVTRPAQGAVPQLEAVAETAGAEVTITPAAQIPGDSTISVRSPDGAVYAAYTVRFAAKAEKRTLLFEIDEGIGENELVSLYKNDFDKLDAALGNIYDSLVELTDMYEVAVLMYPTHHYKREGWGAGSAQPLDRIDAALQHTMQFFEDRGGLIKVYLEIYSSGIATNQNGALASLPPAPLYHTPEAEGRIGLSMDVDTLKGLKDAYPLSMKGIRFHEAYGSDLVWRVNNGQGGFQFDEELVRAFIDASAEKGLKVIWSDSGWLIQYPVDDSSKRYVYDPNKKPYFQTEPFSTLQDYAEEKLGDGIVFNWANNNYHPTSMLGYWDAFVGEGFYDYLQWDQPFTDFPFTNRTSAKWGMSVQSWFWHEMNNQLNSKYYLFGENNMPVEILGAYALKGLADGAAIIQFEPSWYFFNMNIPYAAPYRGNYEQAPDYSERLAMKRLKTMLLNPGSADNPPTNLKQWFDENQEKFIRNNVDDAPLNYWQSTLAAGWSDGQRTYLDNFTGADDWSENSANRYHPYVFSGNVVDSLRIDLHGDGLDELALLKEGAGGVKQLEFYSVNSGLLGTGVGIALDNEDGQFVGLAAANLIAEVEKQGDPDEIVVFRSRAGDSRLNARIYKVKWSDSLLQFQFEALPYAQNQAVLDAHLDPSMLEASSFVKAVGLRTESYKLADHTRSTDRLAVVSSQGGKLRVGLKSDKSVVSTELTGLTDADQVRIAAVDADTDRRDELAVVDQESGAPVVQIYKLDESLLNIRMEASMNTTPYYNQHVASKAIDGDPGTYAQSWSNVPWDLTVDLGTAVTVDQVRYMAAEGNYALHYTIDVSTDNEQWTTVAMVEDGEGGTKDIAFEAVTARYVRLNVETVVGGGADYGHAVMEFAFPGLKPFVLKDSLEMDRGAGQTIDYIVGLRKALLVNAEPLSAGAINVRNASGENVTQLQASATLSAQVQLRNRTLQAKAVTVSAVLYDAADVEVKMSQHAGIIGGNADKTLQTALLLPAKLDGHYLQINVKDEQGKTLSSAKLTASGQGGTGGTGGYFPIAANPDGYETSRETLNGRTIQVYTVKPDAKPQGGELPIDATDGKQPVKVKMPSTWIAGAGADAVLIVNESTHAYRLSLSELDLAPALTAFGSAGGAYDLIVGTERTLNGVTVSITAEAGGKSVDIPFKGHTGGMVLELGDSASNAAAVAASTGASATASTGVSATASTGASTTASTGASATVSSAATSATSVIPVLVLPDGTYGYVQAETADGKLRLMVRGSGAYVFVEPGRKMSDTGSSWASKAIGWLADRRIVEAGDGGKFAPNAAIGRAELTEWLIRAFSPETTKRSAGQAEFADLDVSDRRAPYVGAAVALGWTKGVGDGRFAPDATVTREQMAVWIARVLEAYGYRPSDTAGTKTWKDSGQISGWAASAIQLAAETGLMNGRANGEFAPGAAMTKAEAAAIVYRMLTHVQSARQ